MFDDTACFQMHDLIHDLATYVMDGECHVVDAKWSNDISKRMVHIQMDAGLSRSSTGSKALHEVGTLRTLFFNLYGSFERNGFTCDFSRLNSLRAFSGPRDSSLVINLSSSICVLKHLRYMDLSFSAIEVLPESICSLHNLQTLKLEGCHFLRELPKRMRRLKNLRHVYLNQCYKLNQMPQKIGQITCLKTLTIFIVGKRRGTHLDELKGLNLGGELHITHLNRVSNVTDAKEANLVGKRNLRCLTLSWKGDGESELVPEKAEKVLEALEPHPNLEHLTIGSYMGVQFPVWMNEQILSNIVSIMLSNCPNCLQLPSLGKLPFLRYLKIFGMTHPLYIDSNFQVIGGVIRGFPSLEALHIGSLPSLLRLASEDGKELFPCLTELQISGCPKLTLPCLPPLKYLQVLRCSEVLLRSISSLRSLTYLYVSGNDESTYLPNGMLQNFTSLQSLTISRFSKLKGLPEDLVSLSALRSLTVSYSSKFESFPKTDLQHLSRLESLNLFDCPELVTLPDGFKHLSSLQHLTLSGGPSGIISNLDPRYSSDLQRTGHFSSKESNGFPKMAVLPEAIRHIRSLQSLCVACYPHLASLPNWLGDFSSLQSLHIFHCPKLSSLPASIESLRNLQELKIFYCPELKKRCEKERGEDWYKIAHVPIINLEAWEWTTEREERTTNCCYKLRDMMKL